MVGVLYLVKYKFPALNFMKNYILSLLFLVIVGSLTIFLIRQTKLNEVVAPTENDSNVVKNTAETKPLQNLTPPKMEIDTKKTYTAKLTTNQGEIEIKFDTKQAPKTVNNFVTLAKKGFYDGLIFHRVIKGFMIQGGDPTGTGTSGPGYKFEDENLDTIPNYNRGVVAMANSGPNTNGSQFFIMHKDTPLPKAYTYFGTVSKGLETVDKIAETAVGANDKPIDQMVIEKVEIIEN